MTWVLASIGPVVMLYVAYVFLSSRPNCGDEFRKAFTTFVVDLAVVSLGSVVILYAVTR